jgi:hypothetical protein
MRIQSLQPTSTSVAQYWSSSDTMPASCIPHQALAAIGLESIAAERDVRAACSRSSTLLNRRETSESFINLMMAFKKPSHLLWPFRAFVLTSIGNRTLATMSCISSRCMVRV